MFFKTTSYSLNSNYYQPLTEFDDSLFITLIGKVIKESPKYFNFMFKSEIEMEM